MGKNNISTSIQNKKVLFACQYLHSSSQAINFALNLYNSSEPGSVERSFTEIHKAWNSLWMADTIAINNYRTFITDIGHLYGLDMLDNFIMASDPESPKYDKNNKFNKYYDFESGQKKVLIDSSDGREYIIEDGLRKYRYDEGCYLIRETNLGYMPHKASPSFKNFCEFKSPIRANWKLFYELRNVNQHDFLELANGTYNNIVTIMNPYVISNVLNYIKAYNDTLDLVRMNCSKHKNQKRSGYCVVNFLDSVHDIKNNMRFPTSVESILDGVVVEKEIEDEFTFLAKKRSPLKTIKRTIHKTIQENKKGLPSDTISSHYYKYYETTDGGFIGTPKITTNAIENYINSYEYKSLTEVANKINSTLKIKIKREDVQKIKSNLAKTNGQNTSMYWKSFWEGRERYTHQFYKKCEEHFKQTLVSQV